MASDLTAWAMAIQTANPAQRPGDVTDPAQAASIILDNMKACEPTLLELQSATARRYCRFNVAYEDWDKPEVLTMMGSISVMIKWLFNLFGLHAEAEMVSGRTDLALKDLDVMFRLDDGLKDEPLLMSQLLRLACDTFLLQPSAKGWRSSAGPRPSFKFCRTACRRPISSPPPSWRFMENAIFASI